MALDCIRIIILCHFMQRRDRRAVPLQLHGFRVKCDALNTKPESLICSGVFLFK